MSGHREWFWPLKPQRRVFYSLCANLLINELFWVRAHQCLIGAQEGALELRLGNLDRPYSTSLNRAGTSFVKLPQSAGMTASGAERVPIQSLDSMLTGLAACHLVKVDVEGAEALVLKVWLKRCGATVHSSTLNAAPSSCWPC